MEEKVVRITEDEGVVKTVHQDGSGDLPKEKNIVHGKFYRRASITV